MSIDNFLKVLGFSHQPLGLVDLQLLSGEHLDSVDLLVFQIFLRNAFNRGL